MSERSMTEPRTRSDWPVLKARIKRQPIYVISVAIMILIAMGGFLPRMWRPLVNGTIPPHWIIHVHVLVSWVWLGLLFMQSLNAAMGRKEQHEKLGKVLIGYGALMWLAGMGVTVARIFRQLHAGEPGLARGTNLEPMVDMVVFPFLFGLSVYYAYARKSELHARLMIVTATELMYPAAVRLIPKPHGAMTIVVITPVLVAAAYDWYKHRIIHPVYVFGLVLLSVLSYRMNWVNSSAWVNVIDWFASIS